MKLKSIYLVLSAFVLSSCSILDGGSNENEIIGEWNWIESTNGWTNDIVLPESVGYTQRLFFHSDSTFSHFRADTLMVSGTYSLEVDENRTTIRYQVEYDKIYPTQQLEFLKNNVIKLVPHCMDCGTSTFERNNNRFR